MPGISNWTKRQSNLIEHSRSIEFVCIRQSNKELFFVSSIVKQMEHNQTGCFEQNWHRMQHSWQTVNMWCLITTRRKQESSSSRDTQLLTTTEVELIDKSDWNGIQPMLHSSEELSAEKKFGNRTFDCVRLTKFYCDFDFVPLCSAIERNRLIKFD